MGSGIGNMFGIDKIFGGLLDSIGLGALKPLVSMAFDFATGNIPGMLQDLTGLMSSFGDGGFTNNVATNPPLPNAFSSNNQIEDNEYNTETANQNNSINSCGCREDEEQSVFESPGRTLQTSGRAIHQPRSGRHDGQAESAVQTVV